LNNLFITITFLDRTLPHAAEINIDHRKILELAIEQILTKAALTAEQTVESMCNQEEK
jgi:hypothetical protein